MNVQSNRNLIHLAEECAELIKVIMKISRFGMNTHDRDDLIEEMADVHLAITAVTDDPTVPVTTGDVVRMLPVKQRKRDSVVERETQREPSQVA